MGQVQWVSDARQLASLSPRTLFTVYRNIAHPWPRRQHFQLVDRGEGASGGSRLAGLRKDFRVLEVRPGEG